MLKKSRRLSASEVRTAIKTGRNLRGTYITAKVLAGENGTMRAAAVVPKSLVKSAPKRNALRRALYRAVKELPSANLTAVLMLRSIPPSPAAPALRDDIAVTLATFRR